MDEVRTYLDMEKADKVRFLASGLPLSCDFPADHTHRQIERVIFCVWSDKDKDVYEYVPAFFTLVMRAE
jgi:hypothetical protein